MCPLNPKKATCDNPNSHLTTKIKSFRINSLTFGSNKAASSAEDFSNRRAKHQDTPKKREDQRPQSKALFAVNEDVGYSISYLHRQHLLTKLHPLKYLICRVSSCILKPTILEYAKLDFHNNYLAGFFYWISHVFAFQLV